MNLFDILFGKSRTSKKTRKARHYNGRKHNKSYKKSKSRYHFKHSKSMRNKHKMKGG